MVGKPPCLGNMYLSPLSLHILNRLPAQRANNPRSSAARSIEGSARCARRNMVGKPPCLGNMYLSPLSLPADKDCGNRPSFRFPPGIQRVASGPDFIPTACWKPSPSGMNRALDSQPRVAAARRTLGYERMSLQDMAGIHGVFERVAESPLSLMEIFRGRDSIS